MTRMDPLKIIDLYWHMIPVPVDKIIDAVGLTYHSVPLSDDVSGWIQRTDGSYEIVVNSTHPWTRQRFTAAHELGHYIYHRDLLGDGVGDNRAYRAATSPKPNPKILPAHERQANNFAANLLMPHHALVGINPTASVEDLAEKFGVSTEAMRIRLGR